MPKRNNFGRLRGVLGVAAVSLLGLTYAGVAMSQADIPAASTLVARTLVDENINQSRPAASNSPAQGLSASGGPERTTTLPAVKPPPSSSFQQPLVARVPRVHARTRAS